MKLDDERESSNVEDRRGEGGGGFSLGAGHLGIGGVVIALVVSYFTGISPSTVLNLLSGASPPTQSAPARTPPANDAMATFVAKVLADTEETGK